MEKTDEKVVVSDQKVSESSSEAKRMRQEYEEIKKNRSKTQKNGGKIMKKDQKVDVRASAEAVLTKVTVKLKLNPPVRLAAKASSKSGIGAFQAKNAKGYLKVSVRDHDIIVYAPVSFIGAGKPGPIEKKGDVIRDYSQLAIIKKDDTNLENIFIKALKDPKSWAEWAATAKVQLKKEVTTIKKELGKRKAKPKTAIEAAVNAVKPAIA